MHPRSDDLKMGVLCSLQVDVEEAEFKTELHGHHGCQIADEALRIRGIDANRARITVRSSLSVLEKGF